MSETHELLGRIAALRKRLEQTRSLVQTPARLADVAALAREGPLHDALLDATVRPLTVRVEQATVDRPRQLTARARRLLEHGRELLSRLRGLSDAFAAVAGETGGDLIDRDDPLAALYRETAAMTDTSLRLIPLFPDTATAQLQLCEGLDAILGVVARRIEMLSTGIDHCRAEASRLSRLADLLADLEAGRPLDMEPFAALAEELLANANASGPLHFLDADLQHAGRAIASHSLNVARVAARITRHDPDFRAAPLQVVLAALLHDVGMLRVPPTLVTQASALDDDARRIVESHCRAGAEMATALAPDMPWLAETILAHHEYLDGTGYPDGLRGPQIPPLARLLGVCDVYAAQCAARPYRPARDTRTALADTLLLADQGMLDRDVAVKLMRLSFYPPGSAVEMTDGSVGVVVAAPESADPSRPVIALLADGRGKALPRPRCIDLTRSDGPGVVRSLSTAERRSTIGPAFPEWL